MQGKLITVFGGGGFLGRYVAQTLLGQGARLRIAGRNANSANHIKPLGNLGQVQLMAADIRKPASVARAVMDADAVVNLVGSFADMDAVQNIGAGIVAQAAANAGRRASPISRAASATSSRAPWPVPAARISLTTFRFMRSHSARW
jgi:NADH dehydrogenase